MAPRLDAWLANQARRDMRGWIAYSQASEIDADFSFSNLNTQDEYAQFLASIHRPCLRPLLTVRSNISVSPPVGCQRSVTTGSLDAGSFYSARLSNETPRDRTRVAEGMSG